MVIVGQLHQERMSQRYHQFLVGNGDSSVRGDLALFDGVNQLSRNATVYKYSLYTNIVYKYDPFLISYKDFKSGKAACR